MNLNRLSFSRWTNSDVTLLMRVTLQIQSHTDSPYVKTRITSVLLHVTPQYNSLTFPDTRFLVLCHLVEVQQVKK